MYGFILSKKGENSFAQNFKVLALSTDFLKQKRMLHINTTSFFSGNGNKELAFDSACNTANNFLRKENIEDESWQKYDDNCGKHSCPVSGVFHGVNHTV